MLGFTDESGVQIVPLVQAIVTIQLVVNDKTIHDCYVIKDVIYNHHHHQHARHVSLSSRELSIDNVATVLDTATTHLLHKINIGK